MSAVPIRPKITKATLKTGDVVGIQTPEGMLEGVVVEFRGDGVRVVYSVEDITSKNGSMLAGGAVWPLSKCVPIPAKGGL